MFEKRNQCDINRIMQDSTGYDQLGAWFERSDIAEKIHAGEDSEHETENHILNDFPLMYAHMTDLKSILREIPFLLRETGHISYLDRKKKKEYL